MALEELAPPDGTFVRRRYITEAKLEWVRNADAILVRYGRVNGTRVCDTWHGARGRARRLRSLMIDLGLHEPWQVREHVERAPGGWKWNLEYFPIKELGR